MSLPKFLQPYLASYDLSGLDIEKDKKSIISNILRRDTDAETLLWLFKTFSWSEIMSVVKNPERGMWMRSILLHWKKIFNIKIPKDILELAIIELDPNKKLRLIAKFFEKKEHQDKEYHERLVELGLNSF